MKSNSKLRSIYTGMLDYIYKRFVNNKSQGPTEIERKFIDVLKTIIEGGYSIIESDFYAILDGACQNGLFTRIEYEFFDSFLEKMGYDNQQYQRWCILKGFIFE